MKRTVVKLQTCGCEAYPFCEHAPNAKKITRRIVAAPEAYDLAQHIEAMATDSYLTGHPEWAEIVREARAILAKIGGK